MSPEIKIIDTRTGLSEEVLSALSEKVNAWTGVKRVTDETGSRVQIAPVEGPVLEITAQGELKPVEPNALRIGTPESYVHEVVAANVTIPSRRGDKEAIREVTEDEIKSVDLPAVIRYRRTVGEQREEIGFDLDTAPTVLL